MTDKPHQSSTNEYQIRIDGKPVKFLTMISKNDIDEWLKLCKEHPGSYVDIASIRTEIVVNQFTYHLMKRHFNLDVTGN